MCNDDSKSVEVFKKTTNDHIRSIINVFLNGIPVIGGSLSSLFNDYMPNVKQERLKIFLSELKIQVKNLEEKSLNIDKIQTPEYAYIFEKCFRGVSENYQTERLDAYRAILINSLIESAPSDDKADLFISYVNNLSIIHIRVLSLFNNFPQYCRKNNLEINNIIQNEFTIIYPKLNFKVDFDIFCSTCEQLFLQGLTTHGSNIKKLIRTECLNDREKALTKLGIEFVDFITLK